MVALSINKNIRFAVSHKETIFKSLTFLIIFFIVINICLFYRLKSINYQQNTIGVLKHEERISYHSEKSITFKERPRCKVGNYSLYISDIILQLKEDLEEFYLKSSDFFIIKSRCRKFLQISKRQIRNDFILNESDLDFTHNQLVPLLKNSTILSVENAPKGTQLKLLARFRNNITAVIKPKWYSPSDIIVGDSVAGKDRHTGEVVAFYLSILLESRRVPPSVIRIFDLQKEIISKSNDKLLSTFLVKGNKTCFYGICRYCKPSQLICTDSKTLEACVIYYLPYSLKTALHPWSRTYKCSSLARWETDSNYCDAVLKVSFYSRDEHRDLFLDLIDVSIFDFLISNGDRHHIEYITNFLVPRIVILDNGKSFGNPYVDFIDIMAPLYQCCKLRNSTWTNLLLLRGGSLTRWLKYLLSFSDADLQIDEKHLHALDRRLLIVFATLKYCFQKFGIQNVLVH